MIYLLVLLLYGVLGCYKMEFIKLFQQEVRILM